MPSGSESAGRLHRDDDGLAGGCVAQSRDALGWHQRVGLWEVCEHTASRYILLDHHKVGCVSLSVLEVAGEVHDLALGESSL